MILCGIYSCLQKSIEQRTLEILWSSVGHFEKTDSETASLLLVYVVNRNKINTECRENDIYMHL